MKFTLLTTFLVLFFAFTLFSSSVDGASALLKAVAKKAKQHAIEEAKKQAQQAAANAAANAVAGQTPPATK